MATTTHRITNTRGAMTPLSRSLEIAAGLRQDPMVLDGVCPELCPALEEVILERMQHTRGRRVGSLNVGGWKSTEDFFQWQHPAVQELHEAVAVQMGSSALVAWAMVNRAGSLHQRHQHRIAILSGIYYVTVGDEDAFVPTIFEVPCDERYRGKREDLLVDPHPGRLVICRGATWHRVGRYDGEQPRITVAFDVRR